LPTLEEKIEEVLATIGGNFRNGTKEGGLNNGLQLLQQKFFSNKILFMLDIL